MTAEHGSRPTTGKPPGRRGYEGPHEPQYGTAPYWKKKWKEEKKEPDLGGKRLLGRDANALIEEDSEEQTEWLIRTFGDAAGGLDSKAPHKIHSNG